MKAYDKGETGFTEIMDRIKSVTNTRTQVELAELLGVRQSSISDAKRRCSVPAEWVLKLYYEKRINPEWVMTGNGGKFIHETGASAPQGVYMAERNPLSEYSMEELAGELLLRITRNKYK